MRRFGIGFAILSLLLAIGMMSVPIPLATTTALP